MATDDYTCSYSCAVFPETEGVLWMGGVIKKLAESGKTVAGCCASIFRYSEVIHLAAKALPFLRHESICICFKKFILGVIEGFTKYILNEDLNQVREGNMHAAAKVLMSAIDSAGATGK